MVATDGNTVFDLKEKLLSEGFRYSFIQIYRLLRKYIIVETGATEDELFRKIGVRPDLSLSFPQNDVVSVSEGKDNPDHYSIICTFLGLYGVSSPLPSFYSEDLIRDSLVDISITRDFFDIINSSAYRLLFQCWGRYRLFYQLAESFNTQTLERLYCLLGISSDRIKECFEEPYELLRYIGLATQFPRSAEGLRVLLADAFDEPSFRIEQCASKMLGIPEDQRLILGLQAHNLGEDSCIGIEITSCTSHFRIHAGPLSGCNFRKMALDRNFFNRLKRLVRFYLDQPLGWDIDIELASEDIRPVSLGGADWSTLGCDTWLPAERSVTENVVGFLPV